MANKLTMYKVKITFVMNNHYSNKLLFNIYLLRWIVMLL